MGRHPYKLGAYQRLFFSRPKRRVLNLELGDHTDVLIRSAVENTLVEIGRGEEALNNQAHRVEFHKMMMKFSRELFQTIIQAQEREKETTRYNERMDILNSALEHIQKNAVVCENGLQKMGISNSGRVMQLYFDTLGSGLSRVRGQLHTR